MKETRPSLWFNDIGPWGETHQFAVESMIFSGRTQFQEVAIFESREYGTMLALDGLVQSAEDDEYIYHESLVHPALVAHPEPSSVLVIGGGEGATIREVLRHPTIKRVVMVDIDRELVELCKEHLDDWHRGAFDDPRVELVFSDGKEFVAATREKFDGVIIDVTDALDEGPALALYTEDFYRSVKQCLTASGLIVVQAMELSGLDYADHKKVRQSLRHAFRHMKSYRAFVPSFWSTWGFLVASDAIDPSQISSQKVDEILRSRGLESVLRYYDGQTHTHMFSLPKDIRAVLAQEEG
ncbi:polyamine aminopropyltransferase [bacterium]|nr:MAG: polyamine aminopropyltransferase [bacterium]